MNLDALYSELTLETKAKLVLLVMDGLGDLAIGGLNSWTPLEAASTPALDALTKDSAQGRMIPVAPGITPGSGPGHLALFGYDPLEYQVGRGVIEALGLGLELKAGDVAARANFCTLDEKGIVTDRRAGRIETELCEELCFLLSKRVKRLGDCEVIIKPGKGHRFVVVFRGKGLEGPLTDADPHREGLPIPNAKPVNSKSLRAKKTAKLVAEFYKAALPVIAKKKPANGLLLRGIAHQPAIPLFEERYKLRAACIAVYPMYKGLAQLVGMTKLEGAQTIAEQFERYLAEHANYDFFFIHYKYTDMHGEDGNFDAKRGAIEELDGALPILLQKKPDVLAITADHSTPCIIKGHSWHPQPVLLHSAYSGSDKLERFTETGANLGSLGLFEAKYLLRLMQANARMFDKFGA
ncbi:MAG: 2,3-bisphosphoglycerate-independent phosphoglycerate mutase [Verrucomicrobia subdivision 3 bacterium]|nr:2,3-bisphosphoglycerate-independent phosphoglycerate mutase [Limisphaerales bacterium]